MAIGEVYQIVIQGVYHGVTVNNVFYYENRSMGTVDVQSLAECVRDVLLPEIVEVQGGQVFWSLVEIKQMLGGTDFYTLGIAPPIAGVQSGEDLPPETCWTFRYLRAALGRRHGYKRFVGVTEGNQASGVALAGILTALEALALVLAGPLSPDTGPAVYPVVLSRWFNGQELDVPVAQDIAGVVYSHIGTQNSRKYGRGE